MKREIAFYNQIDYPYEAYQTLCWIGQGDEQKFKEFKDSILKKYGANSEHVRNCIALDEDVLARVCTAFTGRLEEIKELFGEIENEIIPADLVLCWTNMMTPERKIYEDSTGIRQDYEKKMPQERDACFLYELARGIEEKEFDSLVGCRQRGVVVSEADRIRNIFSYIQSMEIKQESKLRIQELYLKREYYFGRATALMDETVAILKEFEGRMQQLCHTWGAYWESLVAEEKFFKKFEGVIELSDDMFTNGFCLVPSVIQCAALLISVKGKMIPSEETYMATCRIGVMLTDGFDWNCEVKEEYRLDEMIPMWKALGDKSKAEILLFIKDKPAYGSEIAKQFSLTTATVSHHMNKLVQLRLVQPDLRDGKVYYQVRKEALRELFEHAAKLFE